LGVDFQPNTPSRVNLFQYSPLLVLGSYAIAPSDLHVLPLVTWFWLHCLPRYPFFYLVPVDSSDVGAKHLELLCGSTFGPRVLLDPILFCMSTPPCISLGLTP